MTETMRGSIDTVKRSSHGRQFLEGGWPLCAPRGQSASRLASLYRPPFLFIPFPLSSISVIDLFFTSSAGACWIFNNGLVLPPLKVRLTKASGPDAAHYAFIYS